MVHALPIVHVNVTQDSQANIATRENVQIIAQEMDIVLEESVIAKMAGEVMTAQCVGVSIIVTVVAYAIGVTTIHVNVHVFMEGNIVRLVSLK